MKTRIFFVMSFLIIFIGISFLMPSGFTNKQPLEPTAGTNDDPYAAAQFRYDMIRGKSEILDPMARKKAINYLKANFATKAQNDIEGISSWTNLGPGNIGGRIRSIIIRPTDVSNILVGGVSGGVWKTTDGGSSWTAKNDDGDPIAISCMVNDGDVVYAGTGEGWNNTDAVYGGGIWKSTDFGENWTLLTSTLSNSGWDFKNVKQLRIDPSGNIYAVTKAYNYKGGVGNYYSYGGLYKSTDGGSSWTKINSSSTNYYNATDVIPISSSIILFATYAGGIFRTTDGGTNWSQVTSGLPSTDFNRIAMTQDPNSSSTVFAVFSSGTYTSPYYGLRGIYKSTDNGATWSELTRPGTLASTGGRTYLNKQGWYGNVIAVDPFNSSNIYVGGVDDMKSTDGGSSWNQLTYWSTYYNTPYVHADHHAIVFDPGTADIVYDGNDGGIYKSIDGGSSWTALNNGLEITQYYGGAVSASGTVYMGGTQDNGHHKYDGAGTDWTEVKGGDGGYAAIDQTNSNVAYEEYTYLQMSKTTDGGTNWSSSTSGLTDAGDGNVCLFISPFSLNFENSNVLVAGSDKVWLTTDGASNWVASSGTLSAGENVSAVTVANSATPYLGFAGTTDGKVFKCTSMTGSSDSWSDITPTGNNGAWVRRVTVDLNDKNKIYACYSGYNNDGVSPTKHVWYSSDQGTNWTDISGNLPDAPVHSLVIDQNNPQTLYVGTEVGVFETTDRGTTWTRKGSGMPDYVPVDELVIQTGTDKLFAFTHGRSVFITSTPLPVELTSFTAKPQNGGVLLNWQTATEVDNYGFEIERAIDNDPASSNNDYAETSWEKIGFVQGHGNSNSTKSYSFADDEPLSGKIQYRLKQIDTDGSFEYSDVVEVAVNAPAKFELSQNYPNPFNPTTTIKFTLPSNSVVKLNVYNALGEKAAELVNKEMEAGYHKINFDASGLTSGVYFYVMQAETHNGASFTDAKKLVLMK
ncbi:MAG: T9SS type A sorting domain-containing protein [Chlorobi bacterium]|nr:T9SS type A sorting domain-containing protein [Chlorobiota bacterium]